MKRLLLSLSMLGMASILAIGATTAYFSDTEVSSANTFTAGTLDLKVDDNDGPVVSFNVSNIAPGYTTGYQVYCLKNTGTIPGQPSVEFSAVTNSENGLFGPEAAVDSSADEGELGQYLKRTIGVGPCGWSVPSLVSSDWQTGPAHSWGTPGLNGLAGKRYFAGPTGYKFPVLREGESYGLFFKLELEEDLRKWDGTKWLDVNDNIIQSDSVTFDIMFHLEQVTN